MRVLLACLLAVQSAPLGAACIPGTAPDRPPLLAATATAPPRSTGFVPVADPRGQAWAWRADSSLRVVLSTDPGAPGVLVEHGDRQLAVDTDLGDGTVALPVLLVFAREDGTDPVAADPSPGLHLLLAGSPEHGCPLDDLELDLLPVSGAGELGLRLHISGIPYLALPPQGTITVAGAEGEQTIDAQEHEAQLGDLQLHGFSWLRSEGSGLGSITLRARTEVPWFQLQGHMGLIEVDMDHSCAADPPIRSAELDLHAWL